MAYFDNINPDLLDRLPLDANRVLEVGCGAGALGAAYKLRNPSVEYFGIELDSNAAIQASTVLDHVYCVDAESENWTRFDGIKFDCIVFGDVLEHLKEPWNCLKLLMLHLSDQGIILTCIPNIQHWSSFVHLLNGVWPIQAEGLFDRTHLRWFTRKTMCTMFEQLGLCIHEIKPRIFSPEKAEEFVSNIENILVNFNIDRSKFLQDVAPLQYVIKAGKFVPRPLEVYALSYVELPALAEVRLGVPCRALRTLSGVYANVSSGPLTLPFSGRSNLSDKIFIWQRPILNPDPSLFAQVQELIKNDYVFIIDFDDDPYHFHEYKKSNFLTFKIAHAVQVSTPEIANLVRVFNPETRVFANNVLHSWPESLGDNFHGLRLFFGALNRQDDWAPMMPSLNRIFSSDPNFWSCSVVHDKAFFEALDLPSDRKSFLSLCDYERYRKEMSLCDIAFMPLRDTPFNRMKSDLKAVEAASHGLAPLASSIVYGESFVDGDSVALFSSPEDLEYILRSWKDNPSIARQIGSRARAFVAGNRLQRHQVIDRERWYRDLYLRKEQLNQDLFQRVPEVAIL